MNKQFTKSALYNMKKLSAFKEANKSSMDLGDGSSFINENLSSINNKIEFRCRKLQ